jgi:hypothetical protein
VARQINLINPALRQTRDALSALPVAAAVGVLLLLIVVVTAAVRLYAAGSHRQAEELVAGRQQAQAALVTATRQWAGRQADAKLAGELEAVREKLKRQAAVLTALESRAAGDSRGFSDYLRGFARQVPQGLWLTGFSIGAGGKDMEIKGRMVSPRLLTEYVRRLNAEPVFRGRSFAGLQIDTPPAGGGAQTAGYREFVLSSVPAGARR